MILLNGTQIKNLSFPDFTVDRFEWKSKTSCTIRTQGALLEKGEEIIEYSSCNLYIFLGNGLSAKYYDHLSKDWVAHDGNEDVRDICEFIYDIDLIIRGFGRDSGSWLELKFISPEEVYAELN